MSDSKNIPRIIPWTEAQALADRHALRQVIVVAWDGELTHVVTYGGSAEDSDQAAEGGNRVKKWLGWPESCSSESPKVAELRGRIAELEADNSRLHEVITGHERAGAATPGLIKKLEDRKFELLAEVAELTRRANEIPGLTAELDELRHQRIDLATQVRSLAATWAAEDLGDVCDTSDLLKLADGFDRRETASVLEYERSGFVRGLQEGRRQGKAALLSATEQLARSWRERLRMQQLGIGTREGIRTCLAALRNLISDHGGDEGAGGVR